MSAYIILKATPHPRRINELETRMRTVMGVMAQKGATNSRLFRNLMGANAGDMGMGFEFENFQKAMNAFMKPGKIRSLWRSIRNDGMIQLEIYMVQL